MGWVEVDDRGVGQAEPIGRRDQQLIAPEQELACREGQPRGRGGGGRQRRREVRQRGGERRLLKVCL
jgi:hypothetical protein